MRTVSLPALPSTTMLWAGRKTSILSPAGGLIVRLEMSAPRTELGSVASTPGGVWMSGPRVRSAPDGLAARMSPLVLPKVARSALMRATTTSWSGVVVLSV